METSPSGQSCQLALVRRCLEKSLANWGCQALGQRISQPLCSPSCFESESSEWQRSGWISRKFSVKGRHAGVMKYCSGTWRPRLLLVNICTFGSKNTILLVMQFSQCLMAEIYSNFSKGHISKKKENKEKKVMQFLKQNIIWFKKKKQNYVTFMPSVMKCWLKHHLST